MIYDIIIIGGGIAGLNIAYQLTKKNLKKIQKKISTILN